MLKSDSIINIEEIKPKQLEASALFGLSEECELN